MNPIEPSAASASIPGVPSASSVATSGNPHEEIITQLLDGRSDWDKRIIRWSDWFNPILVKETRQALKSRQFGWTFILLVIVVLSWTFLGIIGMIPNIYYASDGRSMLSGYIVILLVPALIIIPQAAFRSMASELDDGTFETLSLSMLKPTHILFGKLNVSVLQLIVYMSIVAPCIAMTYLLRGVTLELILYVFLVIVLTTLGLAVIAISLAAFSRSRMLQVIFSLALIGIQLFIGFMIMVMLISVTQQGLEGTLAESTWIALPLFGLAAILYAWLLFACASGTIGVSSENKSTPIRVPLLVIGLIMPMAGMLLSANFLWGADGKQFVEGLAMTCNFLAAHWSLAGAFLVGERGFISIRAKRTLPSNLLSRFFFIWLIPGPGTGYTFAILSMLGATLAMCGLAAISDIGIATKIDFVWYAIGIVLYLALFLGIARLISLIFLRKMIAGRLVATFALVIVLNVIAVVLSCSLNLWLNNYVRMDYDWYCFINPWWTLAEAFPQSYRTIPPDTYLAIIALLVCTAPIALINFLLSAKDIVIQRVLTPPRVQEERAKQSGRNAKNLKAEDEIGFDPLA